MNCKQFLSVHSQYIDGTLDKDTAKEVCAHLKECPACRRIHAEEKALVRVLHTLDDVPVPENLAENILAAVKQGPKKEQKVFLLPRFFRSWQPYSLAAACMLIFTIMYSQTDHKLNMLNDVNVYTVAPRSADKASLPNLPASLPEVPVTEAPSSSPAASASPRQTVSSLFTPIQPSSVPMAENVPADTAYTPSVAQDLSASIALPEAAAAPEETASFSNITGRLAPAPEQAEKTEKTKATNAPSVSMPAPAKAGDANTVTHKTYAEVSSLVKRSITFIVDDTGAASVFQSAKNRGENAVRSALYSAGYDFTTRESVAEEYAAQYNALVKEANSLSARIANGETGLRSRLTQTEAEMQALKNICSTPVLYLAYQ